MKRIKGIHTKRIYSIRNPSHDISENSIAVLYYGHLRSFITCMPETLKNLENEGDLHIYMHTWNSIDTRKNNSDALANWQMILNSVLSQYKIANLCIEEQKLTKEDNDENTSAQYMYYSLWKSNQLKKDIENDQLKRYKRCIKLRPDIRLLRGPRIDYNNWYYLSGKSNKHSDIVATSDSQTMDRICEFFVNLDSTKKSAVIQEENRKFLEKNLLKKNIEYLYGKDWEIIRNLVYPERD